MIRIGFAIVLLTSAVQCPTASHDLLSLAALNFSLTTEKAKDNQVWQEQGLADCPAPVPGGLRLLASSSEAAAPRANKFQGWPGHRWYPHCLCPAFIIAPHGQRTAIAPQSKNPKLI